MTTHRTLFDLMLEEGAYLLMEGLYTHGLMPHPFLRRETEILQICQDVERDWLTGEIASPLLKDVLREASRRLKARADRPDDEEARA